MQIWQICLIVGAIGIIFVLLISISTGFGNGNLVHSIKVDNTCANTKKVELPPRRSAVQDVASYKLSNLQPPDNCPNNYTFYTDLEGNSLCCASSNINVFERTCTAKGKEGVCALVPGIIDTRDESDGSKTYPLCHDIAVQHQLRNSGSLCPARYKYHVTLPDSYKCCDGHVNPGASDCNSGSKFCGGLKGRQTIFNTPDSCENVVLLESIDCPVNTHLISEFKLPKKVGSSCPICIGAKGNCIPRKVIEEAQKVGLFADIDINTNLMNCDVYDKYHNERVLSDSQIQVKISQDL